MVVVGKREGWITITSRTVVVVVVMLVLLFPILVLSVVLVEMQKTTPNLNRHHHWRNLKI